jgi:hypothetical protein
MPLRSRPRKQLFVDPKVQGALALRVVAYWCLSLVTVALMLVCWRIVTGPVRWFYLHTDEMWHYYGPALAASFVLLPLVVVDILRLSNRFAGPLVRLRRAMRALAKGEPVRPLAFREGDFWQEFADEFNAIAARLQTAQTQGPEQEKQEQPDHEEETIAAAG